MKNGIITFALTAIAVLVMSSCKVVANGDMGDVKEKIYNVGQFSSLENDGFVDVQYIPSDTFEVKLSAPEKVIERTRITVENGTLIISQNGGDSFSRTINIGFDNNDNARVKLYVKAPTLRSVSLTGSGDFAVKKAFNTSDFSISTTGSGDVAVSGLQCSGRLEMESEGFGDIALNNAKAVSASLNTEDSGDIALKNLEASKVDISTSGSGDIAAVIANAGKISVDSEGSGDIVLNCSNCGDISGSTSGYGDVVVRGSAKSCSVSSSGSGDVVSAVH